MCNADTLSEETTGTCSSCGGRYVDCKGNCGK